MINPADCKRGELWLYHYDKAMLDVLATDFLPIPNPNNIPSLKAPFHQVSIDGVRGAGVDDKVVVAFGLPESIFSAYVLPGIWIKRTSRVESDNRRTPEAVGYQYRIPAPDAILLGEIDGRPYYDRYIKRPHADEVDISYTIEVRARDERTAQLLERYVQRRCHSRFTLMVTDTLGAKSGFSVFRESHDEGSELMGVLDAYSGSLFTYKVQGRIDTYDEIETFGVSSITVNGSTI